MSELNELETDKASQVVVYWRPSISMVLSLVFGRQDSMRMILQRKVYEGIDLIPKYLIGND